MAAANRPCSQMAFSISKKQNLPQSATNLCIQPGKAVLHFLKQFDHCCRYACCVCMRAHADCLYFSAGCSFLWPSVCNFEPRVFLRFLEDCHSSCQRLLWPSPGAPLHGGIQKLLQQISKGFPLEEALLCKKLGSFTAILPSPHNVR